MEKNPKAAGPENEIKVNSRTFIKNYLAYIARLFDKKLDTIYIKATGVVVSKAIQLANLVRHRFAGIYLSVEVGMTEFKDEVMEGEEPRIRSVPSISYTLSKKDMGKNAPGYQLPLPESEVTPYKPFVPGESKPFVPAEGEGEGVPSRRPFRFRRGGFRSGRSGGYRRFGFRGGRRGPTYRQRNY